MKRLRERGGRKGEALEEVQELGGVERMQCFLCPCQQNKNVFVGEMLGT